MDAEEMFTLVASCVLSGKEYSQNSPSLLKSLARYSDQQLTNFIESIDNIIMSGDYSIESKFYSLLLLVQATETHNKKLGLLLAKSKKLLSQLFQDAQIDSKKPLNERGWNLFVEDPSQEEKIVSNNYVILVLEAISFWFKEYPGPNKNDPFQPFHIMYTVLTPRVQMPTAYYYVGKNLRITNNFHLKPAATAQNETPLAPQKERSEGLEASEPFLQLVSCTFSEEEYDANSHLVIESVQKKSKQYNKVLLQGIREIFLKPTYPAQAKFLTLNLLVQLTESENTVFLKQFSQDTELLNEIYTQAEKIKNPPSSSASNSKDPEVRYKADYDTLLIDAIQYWNSVLRETDPKNNLCRMYDTLKSKGIKFSENEGENAEEKAPPDDLISLFEACITSGSAFKHNYNALVENVIKGEKDNVQNYLGFTFDLLEAAEETPAVKFYTLLLLMKVIEVNNDNFASMLARSQDLLNKMYTDAQFDRKKEPDQRGATLFNKKPTSQEAIIGSNYLRLLLEIFRYLGQIYKDVAAKDPNHVFKKISNELDTIVALDSHNYYLRRELENIDDETMNKFEVIRYKSFLEGSTAKKQTKANVPVIQNIKAGNSIEACIENLQNAKRALADSLERSNVEIAGLIGLFQAVSERYHEVTTEKNSKGETIMRNAGKYSTFVFEEGELVDTLEQEYAKYNRGKRSFGELKQRVLPLLSGQPIEIQSPTDKYAKELRDSRRSSEQSQPVSASTKKKIVKLPSLDVSEAEINKASIPMVNKQKSGAEVNGKPLRMQEADIDLELSKKSPPKNSLDDSFLDYVTIQVFYASDLMDDSQDLSRQQVQSPVQAREKVSSQTQLQKSRQVEEKERAFSRKQSEIEMSPPQEDFMDLPFVEVQEKPMSPVHSKPKLYPTQAQPKIDYQPQQKLQSQPQQKALAQSYYLPQQPQVQRQGQAVSQFQSQIEQKSQTLGPRKSKKELLIALQDKENTHRFPQTTRAKPPQGFDKDMRNLAQSIVLSNSHSIPIRPTNSSLRKSIVSTERNSFKIHDDADMLRVSFEEEVVKIKGEKQELSQENSLLRTQTSSILQSLKEREEVQTKEVESMKNILQDYQVQLSNLQNQVDTMRKSQVEALKVKEQQQIDEEIKQAKEAERARAQEVERAKLAQQVQPAQLELPILSAFTTGAAQQQSIPIKAETPKPIHQSAKRGMKLERPSVQTSQANQEYQSNPQPVRKPSVRIEQPLGYSFNMAQSGVLEGFYSPVVYRQQNEDFTIKYPELEKFMVVDHKPTVRSSIVGGELYRSSYGQPMSNRANTTKSGVIKNETPIVNGISYTLVDRDIFLTNLTKLRRSVASLSGYKLACLKRDGSLYENKDLRIEVAVQTPEMYSKSIKLNVYYASQSINILKDFTVNHHNIHRTSLVSSPEILNVAIDEGNQLKQQITFYFDEWPVEVPQLFVDYKTFGKKIEIPVFLPILINRFLQFSPLNQETFIQKYDFSNRYKKESKEVLLDPIIAATPEDFIRHFNGLIRINPPQKIGIEQYQRDGVTLGGMFRMVWQRQEYFLKIVISESNRAKFGIVVSGEEESFAELILDTLVFLFGAD